jgi:glycogen debranching enzyme
MTMEEIIQVQEQFYILATSSRVEEHSRVLKQGDTFAVFDRYGNIHRVGMGEQGVYHQGTRYLSRLELRVMGRRPLLLSSTVGQDNCMMTVDLTNPDFFRDGEVLLQRDTVHIFRCAFLWDGACYERLRLRNYSPQPVEASFAFHYEADFADIFEVRGVKRERRGELLTPVVEADRLQLAYRGLDDLVRRTTIEFSPPPSQLQPSRADFHTQLPPHGEQIFFISICCQAPGAECAPLSFEQAKSLAVDRLQTRRRHDAALRSSNEQLNDWINRSSADLHLMVTETPEGPYPYAGIPWFSTPFGRDGIITGLELMWINPELARGVLSYLAANQAREHNGAQDADPGKILHETRRGEMAALGEIPFGRYYGSVDSTPLFVVLAGAYYDRTADVEFLRSLWPNLEAALEWMDHYGDCDGDGFIEYARRSPKGLVVQGWKDSFDSVFHADGTLADGPVALCEVQGYAFAARRAAARVAAALGLSQRASQLVDQAEQLRQQFEEAFWCEELSTYALALDGQKRPCRVRTSNPGHCLFSGIVSAERAGRLADALLSEESFSGWGVRTVATSEARYNPMSYHNGSIWPHDNALIAAGLARYGFSHHVSRIFTGMFDASLFVDLHRMPELFCGFVRRPGEGPTLYPVACAPQSWAAGAVFSLIESLLGMTIDAARRQIRFVRPRLPESVGRLWISNLRVADAVVDLELDRYPIDVGIRLTRREGEVEIVVLK